MTPDKFLKDLKSALCVKAAIPIDQQLWSEQDIANYLGLNVEYTRKNVMIHPNFPPSRNIPTSVNSDRVAKRWKASDVVKFAMAFDKNTVNYR